MVLFLCISISSFFDVFSMFNQNRMLLRTLPKPIFHIGYNLVISCLRTKTARELHEKGGSSIDRDDVNTFA